MFDISSTYRRFNGLRPREEKSKRWYEFLTSLMAILGGTFTIVELTSGAVETVGTAVKDALGKKN